MKTVFSCIGAVAVLVAAVYFAVILPINNFSELQHKCDNLEGRNKELTEKIQNMDSMYREVLNYVPDSEKGRLENKGLYERNVEVVSLSRLVDNK